MNTSDHEAGRLRTPFGDVRYVDNQGEGPTLLFCHGNSGTLDGFAAVMNPLARDYRIVAFDFIGFGGSAAAIDPVAHCSLRGQALVLRSVVEVLGLADYVVVGHSLGGHVAMQALPDLRGAVAVVCLAAPPIAPMALGEAFKGDPTGGLLFRDELSDRDATTLASYLAAPGLVGEESYRSAIAAVGRAKPGARSALGRSIGALEISDEVSAVERSGKPSWFVQGTDDPFIDDGYFGCERLQRLTGITVTLVDACGHSPHLSHPDLVVRTLAEAVARVGVAVNR